MIDTWTEWVGTIIVTAMIFIVLGPTQYSTFKGCFLAAFAAWALAMLIFSYHGKVTWPVSL